MCLWLSSPWCAYGCHHLSACMVIIVLVRRVVVSTFWFSSSWYDIHLCFDDLDEQSISDQRQYIKSVVVNMMQTIVMGILVTIVMSNMYVQLSIV